MREVKYLSTKHFREIEQNANQKKYNTEKSLALTTFLSAITQESTPLISTCHNPENMAEILDFNLSERLFEQKNNKEVCHKNKFVNNGQLNLLIKIKSNNNEDYFNFPKSFSCSKILPARTSTTRISDYIIGVEEEVKKYGYSANFHFNDYTTFYSNTCKGLASMNSKFLLMVDIDNFPVCDLPKEEAYIAIHEKYPVLRLLKPNFIVDSGHNGFHVGFLFNSDISCNRNNKRIVNVVSILNELLDGDKKKNTAGSTFGLPYTTNEKSGKERRMLFFNYSNRHSFDNLESKLKSISNKIVCLKNAKDSYLKNELIYFEDKTEIDDFIDEYSESLFYKAESMYSYLYKKGLFNVYSKKKSIGSEVIRSVANNIIPRSKSKKKKMSNFRNINEARIKDIQNFIHFNSNDIGGKRNTTFYIVSVLMRGSGISYEKTLERVIKMNNSLVAGLLNNEIESIISSVYRGKVAKISNNYIYENLYSDIMSDEFLKYSSVSYTTNSLKELYKRQRYDSKRYLKSKKRKAVILKIKIKNRNLSIIKKLYLSGVSFSKIADKVKLSLNTVKKYIKCMNLENINQGLNPVLVKENKDCFELLKDGIAKTKNFFESLFNPSDELLEPKFCSSGLS